MEKSHVKRAGSSRRMTQNIAEDAMCLWSDELRNIFVQLFENIVFRKKLSIRHNGYDYNFAKKPH